MPTAPTVTQIRFLWPMLTSTVISDDDLTTCRGLAANDLSGGISDSAVVSGAMSHATVAWAHLTAHMAYCRALAATVAGAKQGGRVNSAGYLDRNVSFGEVATAPTSATWVEARYASTPPGQAYLGIAQQYVTSFVSSPTVS